MINHQHWLKRLFLVVLLAGLQPGPIAAQQPEPITGTLYLPIIAASATPSVLAAQGTATDAFPGGTTTYQLELLNRTDRIVYNGVLSFTLPSGFSYVAGSTTAMGEGWPMESREPSVNGQTLTWGPYHLPAAGNTQHNPFGVHLMIHSCAELGPQMERVKTLVGNGGYVTQLFYGLTPATTGADQCAVNFVLESYARGLVPIVRLGGVSVNGVWQSPDPGPANDYAPIAAAIARFVSDLPRRDTMPLYVQIWNEPDLWIEWSGSPDAAAYARFFVAVSSAVRQLGDARIRLVNAGLTPGNAKFLTAMLQNPDFGSAFDVWASHCYPYNHPAWYNSHTGRARYDTYAIDCYWDELDLLAQHGRSGVKVLLTETGYELGNNTFSFEGFPAINESNRAAYVGSAFADYWQNWPEVVAVTPFEFGDSDGHWQKFDWVYPVAPYPGHEQYNTVAALSKPGLEQELEPRGYRIIFRAAVHADVPPGVYGGSIGGRERGGNTVFNAYAAPVRVVTPAVTFTQKVYLPLVANGIHQAGQGGAWYLSLPAGQAAGAIVPTAFLRAAKAGSARLGLPPVERWTLPVAGPWQDVIFTRKAIIVLPADGRLAIINRQSGKIEYALTPGVEPRMLAATESNRVLVLLKEALVLVDTVSGREIGRQNGSGNWQALAWDAETRRVFVSDAAGERVLIFDETLAPVGEILTPGHQPVQLAFSPVARRLFAAFPAESRLAVIDVDTRQIAALVTVAGGPILDMALPAGQDFPVVLSALSPRYRGLTAFDSAGGSAALVAGSEEFPLQTASALIPTADGRLILPEADGLWLVEPVAWTVQRLGGTGESAGRGEIFAGADGTVYVAE